MSTSPRRTKVPMVSSTWRIPSRDRELLYLASKHQGVSQSESIRDAIRERAARVLADERPGQ